MSYILEALKKSQQERELGQVPRLQAPTLDEPQEPTGTQRWVYSAVGLAAVAVVIATYAVLRTPSTPEPTPPQPALTAQAATPAPTSAATPATDSAATVAAAGGSDAEPPTRPGLEATASGKAEPLALDDPDGLSVEPQVLVVPAPAKPGERLPRGADELRRAVLGADASPSIGPREPAPRPAPRPVPQPTKPAPDHVPVPPELIAEIEDFKRSVKGEGASAKTAGARRSGAETDGQAAGADAPASGERAQTAARGGRPAELSSSLRRELPPFSMTVHVYDPDPKRRFVYLNGRKVREGEQTRDGFVVEQVAADGAIFRYDEHRFFQPP